MQIAEPLAEPCAFMAKLIDLLGDFPAGRDGPRTRVLTDRLTHLEHEARSHGASKEMLAAIRGAQVLLDLTELPLPPQVGERSSRAS